VSGPSIATRALVAGRFSFEPLGATAGDLMARDVACGWLDEAGLAYDVANAPVLGEGLDWRSADPAAYSHLVFVCGPADRHPPLPELLERFAGCRIVGLDVSMDRPLEEWNPFHALIERDSPRAARPDLAFAAPAVRVPVIGVVLVPHQREYGERGRHAEVEAAIERVVWATDAVSVAIDTALTNDPSGRDPSSLRSAAEAESLIARMDAVVTTRLHGLVISLKAGVPAVAIDPIAGGAKVLRQAGALGWPHALPADELSDAWLRDALDACLSPEGREAALACARRASEAMGDIRERFLASL
jgi:hypothetical protein